MRPSIRLLASAGFPGFWRRSLNEFKRWSDFAIKMEGIYGPQGPLELWNFAEPSSVKTCVEMSDGDIGGYSSASLQHVSKTTTDPAHALFRGNISNKLPLEHNDVQRTGYAAFRTLDRPGTIFGKTLWDVDVYAFLALRIKSDGRKYKVNVQTESLIYTDLHQHRLYTSKAGEWETVLIKWDDFVRTNHGIVVEPQSEMMTQKVRTIGIGLTDRLEGPFEFRVSRIWATNDAESGSFVGKDAEHVNYVPKRTPALEPAHAERVQ